MRRRIKDALIIYAAVAVMLAVVHSPANSQGVYFGKNKVQYKDFQWKILKTPHFDIHFNEGYRKLAARTAVVLEHGYKKLSLDFNHGIPWRIPVILYGSHSDFQQTNVTWSLIPEGVQAFAEPTHKRIVLHYSGSNNSFTHTAIHELTHIFEFDIIYGSLLKSVFSRTMLFGVPLWFMEGISEYYSIGYDREAEMFMRDATVFGYLPYSLDYARGYMVYKAGQSVLEYINRIYGPEKVIEIMDNTGYMRSLERALKTSIGISTEELTRKWKKDLRRRYWGLYADRKEPEAYGRRLTDHIKGHHYMNTKPVFSPDGEAIVFYSDRKGLDGIYLINAITGEIEKHLITGSMSVEFESIRSMKSSLTFSPDGSMITFVAKSDGRDRLFILDVEDGDTRRKIDLPLDFFYSPAWSPGGNRIAMVGCVKGQTDLFIYNMENGRVKQITDNVDNESDPAWFPDGSEILYSRSPMTMKEPVFRTDSAGVERLAGIDFQSLDNVRYTEGDIWSVNAVTGEQRECIATSGNDSSPLVISGGKEIIFTSDESGITNLYRGSLEMGSYYRFTDVLGGLFEPDYAEEDDRLVFSAFNTAGYDLFIMDNFSRKVQRSYSTGGPVVAATAEEESNLEEVEKPGRSDTTISRPVGSEDVAAAVDTTGLTGNEEVEVPPEEDEVTGSISGEVELAEKRATQISRPGNDYPAPDDYSPVSVDVDAEDVHPDSLKAAKKRMKKRVGTVEPYQIEFSPDYIGNGMGLFFSTGFGFGLMNQIAFSDLLGDHHMFLSFNIYRSLEDSDFLFSYYYLKNRIDYAVGVFQFNNYLNSRGTSIGETFTDYRYFTERNYGLFGMVSFPFSTFDRVDLEFQGFISERRFFDYVQYDEYGYTIIPGEESKRRLFQPTISFVHDSAYFGSFGPVIGSRWMASVSRSISFSGSDVSRTTAYLDYRKYLPLFYRNYLAFRAIGAISEGDDQRYFYLGGPMTMRGYDYLQFSGPRMMLFNLEYRFPMIDQLVFGWPGRWGISNIGGTLFLDSGAVWGEGTFKERLPAGIESRTIGGLDEYEFYSDFGLGFYLRFGYLILNFQLGWPTDFSRTGEPVFHFYIGPQF